MLVSVRYAEPVARFRVAEPGIAATRNNPRLAFGEPGYERQKQEPRLESSDIADQALMLRYKEGDVRAFEQLYARHKGGVYRYLLRGCNGDEQQAAELFQDVWANVVRGAARYEPRAQFNTWLYRLAHNRLIDHYRQWRLPTEPLDDDLPHAAPEHQQPEAQADAAAQNRRLLQALRGLPLEQREAFLLKEEGGMSLEEIATTTGVGRETVKSRLRYALAKLREVLADVV